MSNSVLVALTLVAMATRGLDAFLKSPCLEADYFCLTRFRHHSVFQTLIPPWEDLDKVDMESECQESLETQRCLQRVIYDMNCRIQLIANHLAKLQAQSRVFCNDDDNTPFFTPYTAKTLLRSQCVSDPQVAFNMKISLEACKEAFGDRRYRSGMAGHGEEVSRCLLNQEADACVVNAVRYHCPDEVFINYFEGLWFAEVYDVTNGTQVEEGGPCAARANQIFDLFLSLRIV